MTDKEQNKAQKILSVPHIWLPCMLIVFYYFTTLTLYPRGFRGWFRTRNFLIYREMI